MRNQVLTEALCFFDDSNGSIFLYLRVIMWHFKLIPAVFPQNSGPLNHISTLQQCNDVSLRDATSVGFL